MPGLGQRYDREWIEKRLAPAGKWLPLPRADERGAWEDLPPAVRETAIRDGEEDLSASWPDLPESLYLDYFKTGSRRNFETPYFERRMMLLRLVLAECVERKGRFLAAILGGLLHVCGEPTWVLPAHSETQGLPDVNDPVVDLFSAETGALLAWIYFLLGEQLDNASAGISGKMAREIRERILAPCLRHDDFWWMSFAAQGRGVNNWNPWINSNWLFCVLVCEEDPVRRVDAVWKIVRSLDKYLESIPPDGGCDEGPGYWARAGASLYECLEMLKTATGGAIDIFDDPHVQNIARYIYRVHIADRWFVNFADGPALNRPPPAILFSFGRSIGDESLVRLGSYLSSSPCNGGNYDSIGRRLRDMFARKEIERTEPKQPLLRDAWMPDIQVMTARRTAGSSRGFFVAAKGGHNGENHNHNDVGQFVVFVDGRPVIIDVGVEIYDRKTFSDDRYSIWTMQSQYHNLPQVNGMDQAPGKNFAAGNVGYRSDDQTAELSLEIGAAYPPAAGVESWMRSVRLDRAKRTVIVKDDCSLKTSSQDVRLFLVTPCLVSIEKGIILLGETDIGSGCRSGCAVLRYDAGKLSVSSEEIKLRDANLTQVWGGALRRLVLQAAKPVRKESFVLTIELPV